MHRCPAVPPVYCLPSQSVFGHGCQHSMPFLRIRPDPERDLAGAWSSVLANVTLVQLYLALYIPIRKLSPVCHRLCAYVYIHIRPQSSYSCFSKLSLPVSLLSGVTLCCSPALSVSILPLILDSQNRADMGQESRSSVPPKMELRSSCEPCHAAKLKCSRDKPACNRCAKLGLSCEYAPMKRPGRPRRTQPVQSDRSKSPASISPRSSTKGQSRHRTSTASSSRKASPLVEQKPLTPQNYNIADQQYATGTWALDMNPYMAAMDFNNSVTVMDGSDRAWSPADGSLMSSYEPPMLFAHHSAQPGGQQWLSLPASQQHSYAPPPDLMLGSSPRTVSPSYWSDYDAQSASSCTSAKPNDWTEMPRDLASEAERYGAARLGQCVCCEAAATLLLHMARARNTGPSEAFEAYLHVQGMLHWVSEKQKQCQSCHSSELVKDIIANVASETGNLTGQYCSMSMEGSTTSAVAGQMVRIRSS